MPAHARRGKPLGMRTALVVLVMLSAPAFAQTPAPRPVLPFIEDDFARAVAEAQRLHRPLFVDAWAPWCHSCLSFRSFVLTDPALRAHTDRFVWASIDTEKDGSAAFLARHPISAWPSLLVLDVAADGTTKVRRLYEGSLNAGDFTRWLDATAAHRAPTAGEALRARVIDLRRKKQDAACVKAALGATKLPAGAVQLDIALEGLTCAHSQPTHTALRLESLVQAISADARYPVLADDRSSAFGVLVDTAEARGDFPLKQARAASWAAFLEAEAARAPTPDGRAAFDAHRTEAYIAMGEPVRAIAPLQQSARDFPADYNPPARLARALLAAGRVAEARTAIGQALKLVYGPRRARLTALQAEIEAAARKPDAGPATRK